MEKFDVIIIGAGPSGLNCAKFLGDSKYRVLVIEKNIKIGPKVCAGGLTEKGVKYLNLPNDLLDFKYTKIKFHINNFTSIIKHKINLVYTIDRENLGQWQLKKLEKFKNIKVITNSRVSKIEKNYIIVDDNKIFYKFLVGADGSNSTVRKYLKIKNKNMTIAIQYIIPTNKYKEFEIFFDSKLFSAWYGWIFPHKNYVSIGCGCDPNILSSKKLMNNFKLWLKNNSIDISNGKYEAFMLNYDYQGYKFNNVFLVGDSAGLVSGLTGEGIYPALISGEEVAKIILNPKHNSKEFEDLLKIKKIHNLIMKILIKSSKFRTVIFYLGVLLLKIPYIRKKAIEIMS